MSLHAIRLDPCLANVLDLRGPDFLLFYAILLLLGAACAFALRQLLRGPGDSGVDLGKGGALHPAEVAYLAGGPKAAIDAATAALVQRGVLMVTKTTRYLQPTGGPVPQDLHPLEKAVFSAVSGEGGKAVGALRRDVKTAAEQLTLRLQSLDLSPPPERRLLIRVVPMLVMLAVLLVGVLKISVGVGRHRPVGFLVFLCIVTGIVAVAFAAAPAFRTRKGAAFLRRLREVNAPLRTTALHAPTGQLAPADLALAFALFGPAMLVYGPAEDLRQALLPPRSGGSGCGGGSSGCGGGSCGGGGGSCGGGGCGGCGGGGGD
jgi:uncharacterized protein (TIGR04222 family)